MGRIFSSILRDLWWKVNIGERGYKVKAYAERERRAGYWKTHFDRPCGWHIFHRHFLKGSSSTSFVQQPPSGCLDTEGSIRYGSLSQKGYWRAIWLGIKSLPALSLGITIPLREFWMLIQQYSTGPAAGKISYSSLLVLLGVYRPPNYLNPIFIFNQEEGLGWARQIWKKKFFFFESSWHVINHPTNVFFFFQKMASSWGQCRAIHSHSKKFLLAGPL